MTWYAVRTAPGSQKPQREYEVEETKSRKGYRIVPSLNPRESAVERALTQAGFVHYMPAEKRMVRDRLRTDLWKVRRFALLVGYVFIKEPHDFERLRDVPGVISVVSNAGRPMAIDLMDILMLRSEEAKAEAEFDRQSRMAVKNIRRKARTHPELRKFAAKLELAEMLDLEAYVIPNKAA